MIIAYPLFEHSIEIKENTFYTIVIENPKYFSEFINQVYLGITTDESLVALFDEEKELNMSTSAEIIMDYISLDVNDKKNISLLYNKLKEIALNEDWYSCTSEIKSKILSYVFKLSDEIEYNICSEEDFDIESLFKLYKIKYQNEYKGLEEKILDYVLLHNRLKKTCVYFFVNLKSYLSTNEIELLVNDLLINKIEFVLIESTDSAEKINNEERIVIDNDLCQI